MKFIMNKSEKVQKRAHDVAVAQFAKITHQIAKNLKLKRSDKNVRLDDIRSK